MFARLGTMRIDWIVAGAFTAPAVAGVLADGRIADRIDAERSLRVFAGGLVLLALFTAASAMAALL